MTSEPPTCHVHTSQADVDAVQIVRRLVPDPVPAPTAQFRRRSWLAFQRALDPLAPPRPPRLPRH